MSVCILGGSVFGIVMTVVFLNEPLFGLLFCVYVGYELVCINLYVYCGQIGADCVAIFCCYGMSVLLRQGVLFGSQVVGGRRLVGANLWGLDLFHGVYQQDGALWVAELLTRLLGSMGGRYIAPVNLVSMVVLRVRFSPFGLRCSL